MFDFKIFQDYIKSLAVRHKVIAHGKDGRNSFFRMDTLEKVLALGGSAASPYLSIDDAVGRIAGRTEPESLAWSVMLYFLSTVKENVANISDEIERARNQAFLCMMDVYTCMQKDYEEGGACGFMKELNMLKMEFIPIGPEMKNEYGWAMRFSFHTAVPIYNPDNWIE